MSVKAGIVLVSPPVSISISLLPSLSDREPWRAFVASVCTSSFLRDKHQNLVSLRWLSKHIVRDLDALQLCHRNCKRYSHIPSCQEQNVSRWDVIPGENGYGVLHGHQARLVLALEEWTNKYDNKHGSQVGNQNSNEITTAASTFSIFCMMSASIIFTFELSMFLNAEAIIDRASCTASLFSESSCKDSFLSFLVIALSRKRGLFNIAQCSSKSPCTWHRKKFATERCPLWPSLELSWQFFPRQRKPNSSVDCRLCFLRPVLPFQVTTLLQSAWTLCLHNCNGESKKTSFPLQIEKGLTFSEKRKQSRRFEYSLQAQMMYKLNSHVLQLWVRVGAIQTIKYHLQRRRNFATSCKAEHLRTHTLDSRIYRRWKWGLHLYGAGEKVGSFSGFEKVGENLQPQLDSSWASPVFRLHRLCLNYRGTVCFTCFSTKQRQRFQRQSRAIYSSSEPTHV